MIEQGTSEPAQEQSYYIPTLCVRRTLRHIPEEGIYLCTTYYATKPEPGDVELQDQVAFEDVLISMGLMAGRSDIRAWFARTWRDLGMDRFGAKRPGTEPTTTRLPILRQQPPHRT